MAVTVTAEGDNLTYQWFYRIPGEGDFRTSACTGDTFRTVMSSDLHGCLVYCVVTDEAGDSVRSDAAMLTMAGEAPSVIRIPGDLIGDGEVNNKDLIRLFQYLSGYDVQLQ